MQDVFLMKDNGDRVIFVNYAKFSGNLPDSTPISIFLGVEGSENGTAIETKSDYAIGSSHEVITIIEGGPQIFVLTTK